MMMLLLSLVLSFSLVSCQTTKGSAAPEAESEILLPSGDSAGEKDFGYAESRPRQQVPDELVAVFSKGELELDFRKSFIAGEAQLFTAIYEGLFSYHPLTMEPVPAAASRWETSDDRKIWTFTIRESARFQNGDPLRAEDFRAAWLSLLAPGSNAPYSSMFDIIDGAREFRLGTGRAQDVGISAPGGKTLVVRLNSPAAFFPSMLCHHSFSPIHPSMINREKWTVPVSNGPFYIEEINDEQIILLKNQSYWDAGQVSLNKLTLILAEDGTDASVLWNSGAAQWLKSDVDLEALTDRSGIEVNAMFSTHYYYIRSARKPWDDFRVRRALSLVLPWDKIREGHLLPAKTLIIPIPNYPAVKGLHEANVEEAKRLMEEAGYGGGKGLPELVIRISPSQDADRVAHLMAEAWHTVLGVPVKISVVPFRQYLESLKLDDHDVASITWIGDFADPYAFLEMWRRDSNLNDAHHNDYDYEALMEKSMSEEGAVRWETLAEAEDLLLSRGSVLPISHSPAVNIIDLNEISGWFHNVLDIHPFKYLSIITRRPLPGVI